MTSRRVLVALLVAWGMAPAAAADSLVVFRSGKTMRVSSHREEGKWVFLTVSKRSNPKDEPSEIGVLKDSILRYETPQVAGGPIDPPSAGGIGQAANGVIREMSEADALAAAMSSRPGGPRMDEARAQIDDSVPAADTLEGNKALVQQGGVPLAGGGGGGGGPAPEWEIDPEKAGAGSVIRAPLRNMKMSQKYIDRARQLHEQRQAAKAAAAAAAAKAAQGGTPQGEAPPPPPQSPQP